MSITSILGLHWDSLCIETTICVLRGDVGGVLCYMGVHIRGV